MLLLCFTSGEAIVKSATIISCLCPRRPLPRPPPRHLNDAKGNGARKALTSSTTVLVEMLVLHSVRLVICPRRGHERQEDSGYEEQYEYCSKAQGEVATSGR